MKLAELAKQVGWPEQALIEALDDACEEADVRPSRRWTAYYDEELFDWLSELIAEVDTQPEKRMILQHMPVIYFLVEQDVDKAREAMNKPCFTYDPFTGLDLVRIGCITKAFQTAVQTLDVGMAAGLMRGKINYPFFFDGKSRHMTKDFQLVLDGLRGSRVASRMREHLERCAGCAENFEHERKELEGEPVELNAPLEP